MRKYRKYDWPAIFAEFESSNQTQTQFCNEHDISLRYFNQQLQKHRNSDKTRFIEVEVNAEEAGSLETALTITVGRCKIECPTNMPLPSFATLVHSLA
jgi:hypothetical protein